MTNPEIPSAAVASATSAHKMRFLYPLAAVCLAAVLVTPTNGQAQTVSTGAQKQTSAYKALGGMPPVAVNSKKAK
jgi:hypothetical protein